MKQLDTLVIATRNKHKAEELMSMLSDLPIRIKVLSEFPHCQDVIEDGETLEANAIKKAQAAFECTKLPSIADDSGLEVYYLLGEPGVRSARYAGEKVSYHDNNVLLLQKLRQVPVRKRQARFRTVIALAGIGPIKTVEGKCEGAIVFEPCGTNGFGYDPLFRPQGYDKTYAEMSAEEKNRMSHRAMATGQLKELLKTLTSRITI